MNMAKIRGSIVVDVENAKDAKYVWLHVLQVPSQWQKR